MCCNWRAIVAIGLIFASVYRPSSAEAAPARSPRPGPSFACSAQLTASEQIICNNAELSAYDRAMAWAIGHKWKKAFGDRREQQKWLAQRDACLNRRACLLAAYRQWIEDLDTIRLPGPEFERRGSANNRGGDLILGSIQSPTGSVKALDDSGNLFIEALGGDWFVFALNATHFYDPHDGRGANASTGEAVGVVHLPGGKGEWVAEPDVPNSCAVSFSRLSARTWRVEEIQDGCSGIGATLTGVYRK
jgi:hypothetical protein